MPVVPSHGNGNTYARGGPSTVLVTMSWRFGLNVEIV